jgi:uncharacterized protein (TIGR01777 family)
VQWDPSTRRLDPVVLEGADAVVNLAGASLGDKRWNPEVLAELIRSRTDTTTAIAEAIAATGFRMPFLAGSAVGYYGDRGDEVLTEQSAPGEGFLTEVVLAWEAAADPARAAGLPVAFSRTGLVLAAGGGAMARMVPLARVGINGPLGSGRQWWPWISLRDTVAGLVWLVDHPELTGPVNLVGPQPERQRQVASELGRQLHRPALLPAPAFGIRAVLGGFADEVLTSKRVVPNALQDSGFRHTDATVGSAIHAALDG